MPGRRRAPCACASRLAVVLVRCGPAVFLHVRTLAESSLDLTRAVTALNAIGTPALRMSRNEDVEEALREGVRGPEALGPLCPGNGFRSHRCGALGQAREAAPAPAAAATVGLEPLLGLGLGADGPCQEAAGRLTLWISLCCWCRHPVSCPSVEAGEVVQKGENPEKQGVNLRGSLAACGGCWGQCAVRLT